MKQNCVRSTGMKKEREREKRDKKKKPVDVPSHEYSKRPDPRGMSKKELLAASTAGEVLFEILSATSGPSNYERLVPRARSTISCPFRVQLRLIAFGKKGQIDCSVVSENYEVVGLFCAQ